MENVPIIGACKMQPQSIQLLVCSTMWLERMKANLQEIQPGAYKDLSNVIGMLIHIGQLEKVSPKQWKEALKTALDIGKVVQAEEDRAAHEAAGPAAETSDKETIQ